MKTRLLQYLKEHELSDRITDLILKNEDISPEAMVLAAQANRTDKMLWLLAQNAEFKTVTQDHVQDHPLAYAILAACSDEKKQDHITACGIYVYALRHKSETLQKRVQAKLGEHKSSAEELKLSPRLTKAYQYARDGKANMVALACTNHFIYSQLLAHAFFLRHHLALQTIVDAIWTKCKDEMNKQLMLDILENLLQQRQNDCVKFLIIGAGLDLYHIVLKIKKELFPRLVAIAWTHEGILSGFMSRFVSPKPPAKEDLLFIKACGQKEALIPVFEAAVNRHYGLNFKEKVWPDKSSTHDAILNRIKLIMPMKGEVPFNWPDDIYNIVIDYCTQSEKQQLRKWTNHLAFLVDTRALPDDFAKEERIKYLTHQFTLLNNFIVCAEKELSKKTRCSHICQLIPQTKDQLFLALILIAAIIGAVLLAYGENVAGGLLFGVGGLYTLVLMTLVLVNQNPQRFYDLSIADLQRNTRQAAETMLTEFKGSLFANHSVGSKVGEVLNLARTTRNLKQGEIESLKTKAGDVEEPQEETDTDVENEKWNELSLVPENKEDSKSTTPLLNKQGFGR